MSLLRPLLSEVFPLLDAPRADGEGPVGIQNLPPLRICVRGQLRRAFCAGAVTDRFADPRPPLRRPGGMVQGGGPARDLSGLRRGGGRSAERVPTCLDTDASRYLIRDALCRERASQRHADLHRRPTKSSSATRLSEWQALLEAALSGGVGAVIRFRFPDRLPGRRMRDEAPSTICPVMTDPRIVDRRNGKGCRQAFDHEVMERAPVGEDQAHGDTSITHRSHSRAGRSRPASRGRSMSPAPPRRCTSGTRRG